MRALTLVAIFAIGSGAVLLLRAPVRIAGQGFGERRGFL
jgi:hypothetical protein